MRLSLIAVGRLKAGPERELVVRYLTRAVAAGRALGFSGPSILEISESKSTRAADRKTQEAVLIIKAAGESRIVCFDERGRNFGSDMIARWLATRRDAGVRSIAFVIGGADGLGPELRQRAEAVWSFGAATFPHQIVRILAAEQLYRGMTILSGHPYHRGE